ncbi:hypothetical protein KY289_031551 [Solanum tuberosum]|nr:hypothetical protein KY289_031551 [Solanum tuberosum]
MRTVVTDTTPHRSLSLNSLGKNSLVTTRSFRSLTFQEVPLFVEGWPSTARMEKRSMEKGGGR